MPSSFLEEFNFVHEIPLQENPRGIKHVNNVYFFQIFDDARVAYLSGVGCEDCDRESGLGHMVVSNHCDYLAEITAPDHLRVGVKVLSISKHTIKLGMRVISQNGTCLAAEGYTVAVSFDFRNKCKTPIPESVKVAIEALEGTAF